jgi:hypothetical protein
MIFDELIITKLNNENKVKCILNTLRGVIGANYLCPRKNG